MICADNKIEKNKMGEAYNAYGGGLVQGFCGGPEGKRPLGSPRRSWEDKIDLWKVVS
jgi:hypothetical protein